MTPERVPAGPALPDLPTLVEGSNPAGTSLNPAAVQFCLGRPSLSVSPWQPARAATTVTCERRTAMKSCILPEVSERQPSLRPGRLSRGRGRPVTDSC